VVAVAQLLVEATRSPLVFMFSARAPEPWLNRGPWSGTCMPSRGPPKHRKAAQPCHISNSLASTTPQTRACTVVRCRSLSGALA
jgi:hypothetical protein